MESIKDIEKIAYNILVDSKAIDKLPTPVDTIIKYAELKVNNRSLSEIHPNFIRKNIHLLNRAISKVWGAIDLRKKEIYLDLKLPETKKKFVKLHEVGHNVLPWQQQCLEYIDDEKTLDPDEKELFEREASYFASSTFFQLDRFDDESQKYPLSIKSMLHLSKLFGSSYHAAARRYTEFSNKRCGLIILNPTKPITIRNYFQSKNFTAEFGDLEDFWRNNITISSLPFMNDLGYRKLRDDGVINTSYKGSKLLFDYHYFNNTFNYFIFIKPIGEDRKTRVKFIVK